MDLPSAGRQPARPPSRCIRHRRACFHGQVLVSQEQSQSGTGRESTSPARANPSRRSRPRAASRHCPHALAAADPATGPARWIQVTASVDWSAGSPLWPTSGYSSGATGAARQWLHQRNGEEPQELDKQILGASIRVNSASGPRAAETSSYRDALRSRARLNGRSATLTRKFKFDQLGSLT